MDAAMLRVDCTSASTLVGTYKSSNLLKAAPAFVWLCSHAYNFWALETSYIPSKAN